MKTDTEQTVYSVCRLLGIRAGMGDLPMPAGKTVSADSPFVNINPGSENIRNSAFKSIAYSAKSGQYIG